MTSVSPCARWVGCVAAAAFQLLLLSPAYAFDTKSRAMILIDDTTGQVLLEKSADQPLPPASMSKLMTTYMVFERLREGSLNLDDKLPVSEKAWRMGGSKMFVEVGDSVAVSDILRGIIVQSGNDACIVVAEALAGSEEAFADRMTERGREIGLTQSTFRNASGWPDDDHVMSVRDLATLARRITRDFPEFYTIYGEKEFEYAGIKQHNRNPLLRKGVPGVDGLKTGYTEDAGYGLVASAERDGRRLILVIAGLPSSRTRASEAERVLEYGFREFVAYRLFAAGDTVDEADVWLGADDRLALVPSEDVVVTLTREARRDLEVRVTWDNPVAAPVNAGAPLGLLHITAPGVEPLEIPLVAGAAVDEASMFGRISSALGYLIWGSS